MLCLSLASFEYCSASHHLHSSTRVVGPIVNTDPIMIQGKVQKTFHYVGGDEGFDEEAGECLMYHYISDCQKFTASINIV